MPTRLIPRAVILALPQKLTQTTQLVQKWREEEITPTTGDEPVFNIHKWLSRTTLDVIGEGTSNLLIYACLRSHVFFSGLWVPVRLT